MSSKSRRQEKDLASALRLIDEVETLARYQFQLDRRNFDAITKRRRDLQNGKLSPHDARSHFEPLLKQLINAGGTVPDIGQLRAELLRVPAPFTGFLCQIWQHEQDFPNFRLIHGYGPPPYALVFIQARGWYAKSGRPEIWTAESAMYEDMAMAANDLVTLGTASSSWGYYQHKRAAWLVRSIVGSAFYFIESYLNGIAFEALLTRWDKLSPSERSLMAELDFATGREKYTKFRDKLLKYPAIATAARYPALTDQDDDVRLFLNEFRDFRDAIVHASHRYEFKDRKLIPAKVEQLVGLHCEPTAALRCCDSAINLVRKLCKAARRDEGSLRWMFDRSTRDGLFPEKAFH